MHPISWFIWTYFIISLTRFWSPRTHIWCQLSHTGRNLLLVSRISFSHEQWETLGPETRNCWQIRQWGFRRWKRRVTVSRSLDSGTWLRVVWYIGVALGGVTEERYLDEYFFNDMSHLFWRKYIKLLQFRAEGPTEHRRPNECWLQDSARQATHVYRNTEGRSYNNCCSG